MAEFFNLNFTGPEQESILFQSDVRIDDNNKTTTLKVQAGNREEVARLQIG